MQRIVVSLAILIAVTLVPATSFAQGQNLQSLNQQQAQAIADRLSDKYPDYTINVRYNSGIATLIGELYSQEQVADAVGYVKSLPGVDKVNNNLKVIQKRTPQLEAVSVSSRLGNNHVQAAVAEPLTQSVSQPAAAQQPVASNAITQVSGRQQMQGVADFSQQIPSAMSSVPPVTAPPVPVPTVTQAPAVPTPSLTPEPTVQVSYVDGPQDLPAPPSISNFSPPLNNSYSISTGQEMHFAPQSYAASMNGNMPLPMGQQAPTMGRHDRPNVPNYAWPAYAAPNNYSEVAYPRLYCPQAAPYIGPFYPYPQVPLEWRKVTLEWHDGYWWLDFDDGTAKGPFSPLFRQPNPRRY